MATTFRIWHHQQQQQQQHGEEAALKCSG